MGVLLTITFEGKTDSHGRSFTIWHKLLVIALNVRRNSPERSNCVLNVRSIQKPYQWSRFRGERVNATDGSL